MRTGICRMVMATLTACVALAWLGPATADAEIRLALLPRLSATEMTRMFTPLADYLENEMGQQVTLVIPKDFDTFKELIRSGQVDLGFSNPLIYVQLQQNAGGLSLLGLSSEKAGTKFRGIIITRKDSGIDNLKALKGKKLIFVEQNSAAGHIFQMLTLSKAGLDVQHDFVKLPFAKKHSNVAMAVFNRAADAGGLREDDLEKMKDIVDLKQLKVIAFTDYYPNWPLFGTKALDAATAQRMKAALMKLTPNSATASQVVGSAKIMGFTPVEDREFDLLRQAAKVAGAL